MKMIGHQAIGQDVPAGLATGFSKRLQKTAPIGAITKNVFAAIPAIHDMINRSRIFDAQLSRHRQNTSRDYPVVEQKV
jgi:hypothetical protein